jgi:hypothetical protein
MLSSSLGLARIFRLDRNTEVYCLGWIALAMLSMTVYLGAKYFGLTFTDSESTVVAVGALLLISLLFYGIFGRNSRVGEMVRYLALWIAIFPVGRAFTYLSASLGHPLIDGELEGFDKSLGFDWLNWFRFVNAHSAAKFVLASVYARAGLQIVFCIVYFAHRGEADRNNELLLAATLSLILTGIASGIFPAVGAFEHYEVADSRHGVHLHDLHALRDGTMASVSLGHIEGIVTMPSYHAVLAILLTYVYRYQRRILLVVLPLNLLVLVSTLSEGGHYLADVSPAALWRRYPSGLSSGLAWAHIASPIRLVNSSQ